MKIVIPNAATFESLPAYVRIAATCLVLSGCAMSNASQQFRFEEHYNDRSLRDSILAEHPVGSPVHKLVEALIAAGARCDNNQRTEFFYCRHFSSSTDSSQTVGGWHVRAEYRGDKIAMVKAWVSPTGEKYRSSDSAFRFEDYRRVESVQAALEIRHPLGSSVDALFVTIKNAGGACSRDEMLPNTYGSCIYGSTTYVRDFLGLKNIAEYSVLKITAKYDANRMILGLSAGVPLPPPGRESVSGS